MSPHDLIRAASAIPCRPWARHVLAAAEWDALVAALGQDRAPVLLGLWADTAQVHALLRDGGEILLASVAVEGGRYPALSPARPGAAWFERMIRDLWGHVPVGGDARTWLDHGRWPLAHPMSPRPGLPGGVVEPPQFPAPDEPGVMQVPLGPVRGLIEEPAHLRLAARGETVLRAEARLGYAHKGTLALMRGKSPRAAARFVARLAAEVTVAHAIAFARAAEAALDTPAPPRAAALRAVMLEIERIAGHLDDLGRMADAAGLAPLHAAFGRQREGLLRAADRAFGHRLMMDAVVPGGIAADVPPDGMAAVAGALDTLAAAWSGLQHRADRLLARLEGVGMIAEPDAGGIVGRAAGGTFDVRHVDPGPGLPAAMTPFAPTLRERTGDAAARCRVRLAEISDSLRLLRALLDELPEGPIAAPLPAESGEGIGCAESLRGAVWHWLRLDHGQIAAGFPCDPGWTLWPLATAAITGEPVEEEAMIRLSCSLPGSALDL